MFHRWLRLLVFFLVIVCVALVGCAEQAAEPIVEDGAENAAMTEPVALPSGEEALAAAAGQPHVLWFWGSH